MSNRESADLLIEPRWLLPMAPAHGALAAHGVVVSAGRIVAAAPLAELHARFAPRETLLRPRHVLLPGLVNAATQAAHSLLRGVRPRDLGAVAARCASADFVRDGTRVAMAQMLRAGVTCFADLSPLPEEAARAAAAAQMRAAIGLPVSETASAWADNATAYFARAERLWDEYRSDSRISLYFAPLAPRALGDATFMRIRRVADELDARISVDVGEGHWRAAEQVRDAAPGPLLHRLEAMGLLRPGFTAIGIAATDLEALARHGAGAVACPRSELAHGRLPFIPPAQAARGALGTGSPALSGLPDVFAEARIAALAGGMQAGEALRMATLGGATALGLQGVIGSIEPGKMADLVCVDVGTLEGRTAPAIEDALLQASAPGLVSDVWTSGRCALSEGRLLAFDEEEIAALPARWAQRLKLEAAA